MQKVLVANRGEIAVRIIQACHDLGLQTVAVYSETDREALHVLHADEAVCIGRARASDSYLKIANVLSACDVTNADAVHPGYGFLSENHNFASICESCGVDFIGPSPKTISLLGDKARAKQIAKKVGCPTAPGSEGAIEDPNEALKIAKELGFPIFVKAVAGGGGKGIRVVEKAEEFPRLFAAACAEAEINFGNPSVYLEKKIERPRHVEIQIAADRFGNTVHLGERDCTTQRRRQKLIEEALSPALSLELRQKMGEAAIRIVREAGYHSVGTVEFLLDHDHNFYFMEVNTRIQVEHTVTEVLTGIDLVRLQLLIAMGKPLGFKQEDIQYRGHVMQFRINAEDPEMGFLPSPGALLYYLPPGGRNVRVDSACYQGYKIPPYYDAMVAKLIVWGEKREEAVAIAKRALREFHVGGVKTTIPFHLAMLHDERFLTNRFDIHYVDQLVANDPRWVKNFSESGAG